MRERRVDTGSPRSGGISRKSEGAAGSRAGTRARARSPARAMPRGGAGRQNFEPGGAELFGELSPGGEPRYFGTGFPGRGGPGFTGGRYGYGGGDAAPPVMAPEARRYPPGPKGYQRSDERLREDISERLMQARHIDSSDVTVQVDGAKVLLEGTVPERRMKHAIEDLADLCPGVQDIENRIRVRRE